MKQEISKNKFVFPEISNQMWLELGHLNCDICVNSLKSLSSSLQTAKALGKLSVFTAVSCYDCAVDLTTTMGLKKKKDLPLFSRHFPHKRNMWHLVYVDASVMRELTNEGRESSCFPMGRGSC